MKLYLILILGLCSSILIPKKGEDKIYIEEFNQLENASPQLKNYINAIKSNSKSGIDIIHIGDSHVQIGEFSKGILNSFSKKKIKIQNSWYLPNLIFQELSFKNKSLQKVDGNFIAESIIKKEVTLKIGLTGRSFSFSEASSNLTFSFEENIKTFEFLGTSSSSLIFRSDKEAKITVASLSKDMGITSFNFKKASNKFSISIEKNMQSTETFFGIRHNFKDNLLSYSNFGVGGSKLTDFMKTPGFFEQLEAIKPEIIILTLGTNDSYFTSLDRKKFSINLSLFIDKIHEKSSKTEIIFMNAPDTFYKGKKPPLLKFVNDEIERLAKEKSCAFWNWNKLMGGEESVHKWNKEKLMNEDLLHFSSKGYLLLGNLFVEALLKI